VCLWATVCKLSTCDVNFCGRCARKEGEECCLSGLEDLELMFKQECAPSEVVSAMSVMFTLASYVVLRGILFLQCIVFVEDVYSS
jgi:hypothetical protein